MISQLIMTRSWPAGLAFTTVLYAVLLLYVRISYACGESSSSLSLGLGLGLGLGANPEPGSPSSCRDYCGHGRAQIYEPPWTRTSPGLQISGQSWRCGWSSISSPSAVLRCHYCASPETQKKLETCTAHAGRVRSSSAADGYRLWLTGSLILGPSGAPALEQILRGGCPSDHPGGQEIKKLEHSLVARTIAHNA